MDNNMRCFEYSQIAPGIKERLKLLEKEFLEKISVDELLGCIPPLSERCSERIYEGVFLAAAESRAGDKHPVRAWCLRQKKEVSK